MNCGRLLMHQRRKWQATPVFLPGESQGRGSLVGCRLWGCTESDTTEATQQQQQEHWCTHTFTEAVLSPHTLKEKGGYNWHHVCFSECRRGAIFAAGSLHSLIGLFQYTWAYTFNLDGHESEWTPGDGDGQGGLACCDSWGRKESDTTERLNWTELNWSSLHNKNLSFQFECHIFR